VPCIFNAKLQIHLSTAYGVYCTLKVGCTAAYTLRYTAAAVKEKGFSIHEHEMSKSKIDATGLNDSNGWWYS
jgi:hypothetical protein